MSSEDTQFKKGAKWTGNRKGRPKGKTIKERILDWLEKHPEDMEEMVKYFVKDNRELTWQMLEGRPQQTQTLEGSEVKPLIILDDR